ncbi:hypothetical protein BV20DRAFT_981714 [Pilatotrama ljubarskyi]|nr:hypothetical protein BV20DRAFT_981714 [Pilatotrama ljubarskyi]
MSDGRGLPLLSGPPPDWHTVNESSCRKCNKEFNLLFARSRRCNHCGYSYCHSCTDFQALMPRRGSESGYDPVPVCAFCIELLQKGVDVRKRIVTASGKGQLKQVPMAKLKKYAKAYNINVDGVIEKDEFVERLVAARGPNGCLPLANENYYRKYSVPNRANDRPRGLFTRAMDAMGGASSSQTPPPRQQQQPQNAQRPPYQPRQRTTSGPSRFPRPDVDPQAQQRQHQQQQQYQWQAPRPAPTQSQQQHYAPPPGYPPGYTQQSRPGNLNVPPAGRPRSASATGTPRARSPAPPPPPVEVPSIDELLNMSDEQLARLSVGVLKEILFKNHVNARLVVEKSELVARVRTLIEDERAERERHARAEEEERMYEEELRRAQEESLRESRRETRQPEPEQRAAESSTEAEVAMDQAGEAAMGEAGVAAGASGGETQGQSASHPTPVPQATEGAPTAPPPSTPPKATASPPPVSTLTPKAQAMASRLERTGLCVICQDEEANIAIVDCGHLALCRGCSDLIMKSTRECPLCRTRIVTESRLLRIFKA